MPSLGISSICQKFDPKGLIFDCGGNDSSHESAHRIQMERCDEHVCELMDAPPARLHVREVCSVAKPAWGWLQVWSEVMLGAADPPGRRRNGRTSAHGRPTLVPDRSV